VTRWGVPVLGVSSIMKLNIAVETIAIIGNHQAVRRLFEHGGRIRKSRLQMERAVMLARHGSQSFPQESGAKTERAAGGILLRARGTAIASTETRFLQAGSGRKSAR